MLSIRGDLWHDNPAFDNAEMQERVLMCSIKIMKAQLRYIEIIEKVPDYGMADLDSVCLLNIMFPNGREDEKKDKNGRVFTGYKCENPRSLHKQSDGKRNIWKEIR